MALLAAALVVGGSLLAGKIASNRANDPKAAIGSGTAPSLQPGGDIQITPVEGSDVQDFGNFGYENMLEPKGMDPRKAQLLAMFEEAGVNPEGLMALALGGPVQYKANGFGITNVLDPEALKQMEEIKAMIAQLSGRPPEAGPRPDSGVDFESGELAVPTPEELIESIAMNDMTTTSDVDMGETEVIAEMPTEVGDSTMLEQLQYYADENPELFTAGVGALSKVINASLLDVPERKGNIVSTQTLPGNASRRRNNLSNIQPIGGSKVTYANQGQALKRPMFMPQGGQMRGPGGPKDDLIPVMASNGEYMLSKAAVDAAGNGSHAQGLARLDAFNKMGNKRYG
jgi:hypothetical protein